jgi:K+-sensing histidine kinase KdpD
VPEAARYHAIKTICFACDTEKLEESTLIYTARDFAQEFGAELEIVTVDKADKELVWDKTEVYSFVEKHLQGIRHKQVHIEDEDISKTLEYYFKFHKADLVMVNPKKHNLFEKLFSESITKTLAFTIETPLLVIH